MEISIVIPAYNREKYIADTLRSVSAQTYRPLHIILVDNDSADSTLSIMKQFKAENESHDFKVSVISESLRGAANARNSGAKFASSEWLMFFDSDDLMHPKLLETYANKINSGEHYDIICTKVKYNVKGTHTVAFHDRNNLMVNNILHSMLATQRYIVRKSLFNEVGCWDGSLFVWDDWELGVRLLLSNPKIGYVDKEPLVEIIIHDNSITGPDYSSKAELLLEAIRKVEDDIKHSNIKNKDRYLKYVIYRQVLLAGLFFQEGNKELSKDCYKDAKQKLKGHLVVKSVFSILYMYVCLGGRGSMRLVKHIIK